MRKFRPVIIPILALIVIVIGRLVIVAQEPISGTWKATYVSGEDKINLRLSRKSDKNDRNQTGSGFKLSELRGLSESDLTASNSNVRFALEREAGNIECDGKFENGKGSGTFRFVPSSTFLSAMKSRGFDFEKPSTGNESDPSDRIFAAAMLNVTVAVADDLLSSGFGKIDIDDLFKAVIFKIDGNFAREMKATGFQNLSFDDLVKARIFKIDAEFVREAANMGLQNEPFESLVKMRIFKISPEFVSSMRSEGFEKLDMEDLVKLRIFNIDAEFIRKARSEGVPLNVEKLVQRKIGVYR